MFLRLIVVGLCFLIFAACSSTPSPDSGDPPLAKPKIVGLLEVTVSGLESAKEPSAKAQWVTPKSSNLSAQSITLVNSFPTIATRVVQVLDISQTAPQAATRYVSSVLEITNTTAVNFNNLTFYALNDPNSSLGGTALTSMVAADGLALSDATLARSFVPTHGVYNSGWAAAVNASNAHLSFLTRDEVANLKSQLAQIGSSSQVEPLQYSFVGRNARGGLTSLQKRIIGPKNCTPSGCNKGYLVISYAYPRNLLRSQSPDTYTMLFAVGYDENVTWSQSLEEQKSPTVAGLALTNPDLTSASEVRTLSGTSYQGSNHLPLCRVVTAGSLTNPLAWIGAFPNGQSGCTVLPPQTFNSTNITPTGASLNWSGPVGASSYNLERGLGSAPTSWIALTLNPNTTGFNDSQLTPLSSYTYRLRANSSEGSSPWITLSITTPQATPNSPQNFTSAALTYSSTTLSWTPVANADSYTLERGLGNAPSGWIPLKTLASTSLQDLDLSPNTSYSYRLKANNSMGSSPWASLSLSTSVAPDVPSCTVTIPNTNESIAAYTQKTSYLPGEDLELKVNSPSGKFMFVVFREGSAPALNNRGQIKLYVPSLDGIQQAIAGKPYEGVNWSTSYKLSIPLDWSTGLYNARVIELQPPAGRNRWCTQVAFVVKRNPALSPQAAVVVLAANYTWQAYNAWGGASFYACPAATCDTHNYAPLVSFQRPLPTAFNNSATNEHLAWGLYTLLNWLETQGYRYDLISDSDLDSNPNALQGYKVFVLDRHSEYVTSNMYDRMQAFINAGNFLVNPGGDQVYWKVVTSGQQIEVRKDAPYVFALNGEPGGLWRNLGRPESALLGVEFSGTDMHTFGPYVVRNANHWALAGTGLKDGDNFGVNSNAGQGCSGWETDKVSPNSPANLESIAKGVNPYRTGFTSGDTGADMVYYQKAGGGGVFSGGSLALVSCARTDPVISRILRNVFDRFLGP